MVWKIIITVFIIIFVIIVCLIYLGSWPLMVLGSLSNVDSNGNKNNTKRFAFITSLWSLEIEVLFTSAYVYISFGTRTPQNNSLFVHFAAVVWTGHLHYLSNWKNHGNEKLYFEMIIIFIAVNVIVA